MVNDPDDRIAQAVAFVPPVPAGSDRRARLEQLRRLPTAFQEVILLWTSRICRTRKPQRP